jgi:hypothetical protein
MVIAQDTFQCILKLAAERTFLRSRFAVAAWAAFTLPEALLFLVREVVGNTA